MIELKDVTKCYGSVTALSEVTLNIDKGETFGLLGPNGAGKTTTLRLVSGLARPTRGVVRVEGRDPWQEGPAARRHMGVVMDGAALYNDLTVKENLLLFGRLYGAGTDAVAAVMEELEITDLQYRLAGKLSKGQRQRVALARALVHRPRLLFLDEPTAGLDPAAASDLHERISELRAQGVTILLSSHDMGEVEKLCDRVGLLHCGRLLACDTPERLKAAHGPTLTDVFIQLTRRGR